MKREDIHIGRLIGFVSVLCVPFHDNPDVLMYLEEVKNVLKRVESQGTCRTCRYNDVENAIGPWDGSCKYWNTHSVLFDDFCSRYVHREQEKKERTEIA